VIGLDTNVLVRYLTRDDETQFHAAQRVIREVEASGTTAHIDVIVLAELSWVLEISYGFDRPTLVSALAQILQTVEFTVEDRDLAGEALSEFAKGKAGFADYLIGARNRSAGCDVTATLDRALRKSGAFRVL
jgi:predicted nucleic-acid-binding protein